MNAITDQPSIGWLMVVVAVWTVAIGFILFALAVLGPELWRAMREWFAPVRVDNVVSIDERRRQLRAASGWTRDVLVVVALVGAAFATLACAPPSPCLVPVLHFWTTDDPAPPTLVQRVRQAEQDPALQRVRCRVAR